jgi:hypothetical protein
MKKSVDKVAMKMTILSTMLWMIINRIVDDYLVPRPLPGSPTNLFGGEERIEDSRTHLFRNSRARVLHSDLDPVVAIPRCDLDSSFVCVRRGGVGKLPLDFLEWTGCIPVAVKR